MLFIFCNSCDIFFEHVYFMRVHNNTNDTILVYAGYNYPDTSLIYKKPRLIMIYPNSHTGGLQSAEYWADKLKSDTLSVFILSKDSVDIYNWEQIRDKYNILKRYDLSINELENQKWTIVYP